MKKIKAACLLLLISIVGVGGCSRQGDSEKTETITVWHYYNGSQMESFNRLVKEFNETRGKEEGIIVKASNHGSVSDLENSVLDSVNGKAGALEIPDIFAAYADTAYAVDQIGYVADLSGYFTGEELSQYIDSYIEEGYFGEDGGLKIFPIAKSTEVLMLNKTDWETFSQAMGTDLSALSTWEGIVETAQKYYEWSDGLTPDVPGDGKAFFGRDALANYFYAGFRQHGKELFSVDDSGNVTMDFDREIVKKLWDNYYVPYIKGYFVSFGRFRTDDIKTGQIISMVGSTSGATYFPDEVTINDNESYSITSEVLNCPVFEGQENVAVQQGAGMVVTSADEQKEKACVEFLKWFTAKEQNTEFSISSGYMPVKKEANDMENIKAFGGETVSTVEKTVETAIGTVNTSLMYNPKVFKNSTKARNILEYSLSEKAAADRQAVSENLAVGMSLEDAAGVFVSEENFNQWYEQTRDELEKLLN